METAIKNMFETIFNQTNVPIAVLKANAPDFTIVALNDMYKATSRTFLDDAIGKKVFDIYKPVNKAGERQFMLLKQGLAEVMETKRQLKMPVLNFESAAPDGSVETSWWQIEMNPILDEAGAPEYIVSVTRNVTGQQAERIAAGQAKHREAQLQEELASMNEELSATNEELTAAVEELRLSQESLFDLNSELEDKIGQRTKELQQSESRFRELVQNAPVPIIILRGHELIVEIANQMALGVLGKGADMIGKQLAEAMPELKDQSFLQLLDNVLTSGTTYHADEAMVLLNIDGATVTKYFAFIYDPIKDDQGGFNGIICVATEVTSQVIARQEVSQLNQDLQTVIEELRSSNEDLKQSQDDLRVLNRDLSASKETFRLLADNIAQLAWMADETGNIFWYNQRWYDYTGATFEEMNGWGWQTVHHADHLQRVIKKWSEHLQCGEIWEDVFPLLSKSGEFRWFLSRAIPIRNEEGKIIRWMGTNTDIDDQRKLEQQKDDFLSIASHELKTPITSLKASLQLLDRIKDNPTDQILPKLITQSNKSVQKVSLLVEDLLNVSRVTQGQLKLAKTQFKLSGMIDSCCGHIRLAGEYTVNVEGDINLEVVADEHQVEQVLVNFVNNAIKYAPESKNIYIIIEKLNKTGKVSVKDLGPGIPPDKLKHLFNRYYRATASNNQTAGLGLGLYISAEIIKLHDGEVGVESELGKGSTFWFTLPLD